MAYAAARVAQGLSAGTGLWVLAWQCQADLGAGAVGVAGGDRTARTKSASGVSVSQVPVADGYRGLGSTGLAVWIVGAAVKNPSFNSTQEIAHRA